MFVHDASALASSYVLQIAPVTDESPGAARQWATPLLAGTPQALDTVLLGLTELLTNAVRYAPGPAEITLVASLFNIEVVVADDWPNLIPNPIPEVDWSAESGRGLSILNQLGHVTVRPGHGGWAKEVAFTITITGGIDA